MNKKISLMAIAFFPYPYLAVEIWNRNGLLKTKRLMSEMKRVPRWKKLMWKTIYPMRSSHFQRVITILWEMLILRCLSLLMPI